MELEAKNPRISVNKLAEYIEAIPTRRKKIVEDAKYPKKFITTRYKETRNTIKEYLQQGLNEELVLNAITDLENKEAATEFQEQDNKLSMESLELLLETDLTSLEGYQISAVDEPNKLVNIQGVDVSVNPDLILAKEINGQRNIGAVKVHLSKNNVLSEEGQKLVSVMIFNYASQYLLDNGDTANLKFCMSLDIFGQSITCCPTGFALRMRKIETACEEISLWWARL